MYGRNSTKYMYKMYVVVVVVQCKVKIVINGTATNRSAVANNIKMLGKIVLYRIV